MNSKYQLRFLYHFLLKIHLRNAYLAISTLKFAKSLYGFCSSNYKILGQIQGHLRRYAHTMIHFNFIVAIMLWLYSYGIYVSLLTTYSYGIYVSLLTTYSYGIYVSLLTTYSYGIYVSLLTTYSYGIYVSLLTTDMLHLSWL